MTDNTELKDPRENNQDFKDGKKLADYMAETFGQALTDIAIVPLLMNTEALIKLEYRGETFWAGFARRMLERAQEGLR